MSIGELFMFFIFLVTPASGGFREAGGVYCGRQNPPLCCNNRKDNCSLPVLDTLCYCDEFCFRDRPRPNDCCYDYMSVCQGKPIELVACSHNGAQYTLGQTFKDNCKQCECTTSGISCAQQECLVKPPRLLEIERRRLGWTARNYSRFWGLTLNEGLQYHLGTFPPGRKLNNMRPKSPLVNPGTMPRSFDARITWPRWISEPLDQGPDCASSWVYSTIGVASDRARIMSKGAIAEPLAVQQLLDCNAKSQRGCSGGYLAKAWDFIQRNGLLGVSCYPTSTGRPESCKVAKKKDSVFSRCHPNSQIRGGQKINRFGKLYRIQGEDEIMGEIQRSGPVQSFMEVTEDFFTYESGIFKCTQQSSRKSWTSVRILGWGEQYGEKYWIISNSWGTWWGENGFMRVQRGENDCKIETMILGIWADIRKNKKGPRRPYKDNEV